MARNPNVLNRLIDFYDDRCKSLQAQYDQRKEIVDARSDWLEATPDDDQIRFYCGPHTKDQIARYKDTLDHLRELERTRLEIMKLRTKEAEDYDKMMDQVYNETVES